MPDRTQKQRTIIMTIGVLILAVGVVFINRTLFIVDNVSTNDGLVLLGNILTMLFLLTLPFLAKKCFPDLARFELCWTKSPRAKLRWYIVLFGASLTSFIVFGLVARYFGLPTMKSHNYSDVTQLTLSFFVLAILCRTILTPIAEEVFWRGFIQDQFSTCFGKTIALFLQAFLFALYHGYPLLSFMSIFVFGLIMGLWRLKRRSLLPIIIVHSLVNGLWCLAHYPDQYEMSKVNIAVNYVDQINHMGSAFPSEDNAQADYQKALELSSRPPTRVHDDKLLKKNVWIDELTDLQHQDLRLWIKQNKEALVSFRLAAQKSVWWSSCKGSNMLEADDYVQMEYLHELADCLIWRAKFLAAEGEVSQAIEDIVSVQLCGNQFLSGPKPTISWLIGSVIRNSVCNAAFQMLDHIPLDASHLAEMQTQMQQTQLRDGFSLDLTWEQFNLYDIIQRIFTDDGDGNGHIPQAELKGMDHKMIQMMTSGLTNEQIESWNQSDRKTTTQLVDKLFDFLNRVYLQTPAQLHNSGIDINQTMSKLLDGSVLCMYIPPMSGSHQMFYETIVTQDALITTLATKRYEKANHRLPENLEVLVESGFIGSLPIDPFSDRPLIYKTTGSDFILYSVGTDFVDNDGTHTDRWHHTEGDRIFWPPKPQQTIQE